MAIYKCKMCGGALEINNNESVATCEYCGTKQTLPKLDDERRMNLYDRANHFRRNNEFDKAMGIYEQVLNEDNTDGEAYWSLVLCRYGIEYVEDPSFHKHIPTVNRAQFTSIFDDDNYKSALQYADEYQKSIYEEEARTINEIQKGILAISQKEEPFDVFICYKETDNGGRRTSDSVLANDLYHQLSQEGFKVFFARITLEDKLGSAYEPYIFAALNSAKVMVVLGTTPEYFKAVWVRNEWSRYLALIKCGQKKMLIPAYKDMDPYDLPEEFSHLQAQDMSKLGFMQDLIRGIGKIIHADISKTSVLKETVITNGNANIAPLLKRAFMFLEDEDWKTADEYCEKVLDIDPENALAYLGKLMAEMKVDRKECLNDCRFPFDGKNNYEKVIRFADDELKSTLIGCIEHINIRNEYERLDGIYNEAESTMAEANTESEYTEAAQIFESISEYKDSAVLAQDCYEKAQNAEKDAILEKGKNRMIGACIANYEAARKLFETIHGWKDADELSNTCQKKISELKAEAEIALWESEKRARRKKRITTATTLTVCAIIAFVIILITVIIPKVKYNNAIQLTNEGNYTEAYDIFNELGDYKDSAEKAANIRYARNEQVREMATIGDYIEFGAYEQDNNISNGKEAIEWLVLDVKDGKALIISKYALDCQKYNASYADVTWETCTLREWLNNDFVFSAFDEHERSMIPAVIVSSDENPKYSTNSGAETLDKVFLLSTTEANEYFGSDTERECEAADYTTGAYIDDNGLCWWWLRTPGLSQSSAVNVRSDGNVIEYGSYVNVDSIAVRPVLWIKLSL